MFLFQPCPNQNSNRIKKMAGKWVMETQRKGQDKIRVLIRNCLSGDDRSGLGCYSRNYPTGDMEGKPWGQEGGKTGGDARIHPEGTSRGNPED